MQSASITNYLLLIFHIVCMALAEEASHDTYDSYLRMFGDRMFSVTCEGDNEQHMSEYTGCVWPHGDLRRLMTSFLREARTAGCKMPPRSLVKAGLEYLSTDEGKSYESHALYSRIPIAACGRCARRAQCCTLARSFLTQSFRSQACEDDWRACEARPLDDDDLTKLREWYPTIEPNTSDRCDFSPWVNEELRKLHGGPVYPFVARPLCQLLGTTRPTFNCVTVGTACRCCCFGHRYNADTGNCVVDENEPIDENLCANV